MGHQYGADEPAALAYRIPTADLVLRDLVKAKLYLPQDMPCYPIIHGEDWGREVINRVVGEVLRRGHNGGIVWQGTSDLTDYKLDH